MTDAAKRLVSAVHVHRRDPDSGAVLETVVVENKTLRKALRQHPWLEAELEKSPHVWEAIPQTDDEDDEPFVTDAGNSGGRVRSSNPASAERMTSAFAKNVEDGELDPESEGASLGGEDDPAGDELERPSKSGSKADWIAYAESVGVTVGEDAKRDDVIAAVERAGK